MKGVPKDSVLIGLTSIYWRESWKYGERAFRYCNHDIGHAIGCLAYSARLLGWSLTRLDHVDDEFLSRLLCTDTQTGIERENGDCLFVLSQSSKPIPEKACRCINIPTISPKGDPNRLSKNHQGWPVIDAVSQASCGALPIPQEMTVEPHNPPQLIAPRELSASMIIRQRRSARDMDGKTAMDRDVFYHIMQRLLPGQFPFNGLNFGPHVSLALFVNRVTGLVPGLYALCRGEDHEKRLRNDLTERFSWEKAEGTPSSLPLYRLVENDVRDPARLICCHQDIARDGAFAVAMLADFDAVLERYGAPAYPALFWETGLIGQVLYLQAEAAGLSGTGIGCFFDDLMHKIVGINDHRWQSLYHFTVGKSIDDDRVKTIAPYHHLVNSR
jgi:nitroreductase